MVKNMSKQDLKLGDYVSWSVKRKKVFGQIVALLGNQAHIHRLKSVDENKDDREKIEAEDVSLPISKLTKLLIITAADIQRLCRFEVSYSELMQSNNESEYHVQSVYRITADDILTAIGNFKKKRISKKNFGKEWFWPLWDIFYEEAGIEDAMYHADLQRILYNGLPDEHHIICTVFDALQTHYEYGEKIDFDYLSEYLSAWLENSRKPIQERILTDEEKKEFILFWRQRSLKEAEEEIKQLYRKCIEELCEKNDRDALITKAYACYGYGDGVYAQDWYASRDCLLKVMDMKPEPQYANTLGYIYYYGRCNQSVPEYDKAFRFFSIGAAGGYPESQYKLADMFMHGYGVGKDEDTAFRLVWQTYKRTLQWFRHGNMDCEFADSALRMGNLFRKGIGCFADPDEAYYYYLQARFAISMRMLQTNQYGDGKVAEGIEEGIRAVLPDTENPKPKRSAHYYSLSALLYQGLRKHHTMKMQIQKRKEGLNLTFWIQPFENETYRPKLFVTVPQIGFSGFLEKVTVKARNVKTCITAKIFAPTRIDRKESSNQIDKMLERESEKEFITFDFVEGKDFYFYGKKVATIDADYVFTVPLKQNRKYRFAAVRFASGPKEYHYRCDLDLQPGDNAIVQTAHGEDRVTVTRVFDMTEAEMRFPLKQYKSIIRKADKLLSDFN